MAPVQTELQVEVHNSSDVINLVYSESTWRDLLIELVDKNRLDPWDIDIVELVGKYLETIKRYQVLDLKIPANIMLATSILVRLKSDAITFQDYEQQGEIAEEIITGRPDIIVDPLNFRLRIPPKRRISLSELLTALDEAIQIKETRTTIIPKQPITLPITIESFDIEAETEKLFALIKKNVDKSKMITFSQLSSASENDVLLGLFIPLLFLAHQEKVSLIQEKFFSEIIIAVK